jgi:hypothetical protein
MFGRNRAERATLFIERDVVESGIHASVERVAGTVNVAESNNDFV